MAPSPTPVTRLRRLGDLPWPWRVGLGVPLLAGVVLAIGAAVSWVSGGYERPDTLEVGRVEAYPVGAPKLFEEDDIWVVRLVDGEFRALYDRGLGSGCPLQWRREFVFMERVGWFVDACTGAAYDLAGRCFSDPCRGALLDRFAVDVESGSVIVRLREIMQRLPVDMTAEPVNPPPE